MGPEAKGKVSAALNAAQMGVCVALLIYFSYADGYHKGVKDSSGGSDLPPEDQPSDHPESTSLDGE